MNPCLKNELITYYLLLNLTPGQVFSIPLIATDPNGAPITMTVETNGSLPTGSLTGENTLILKPTPTQLGSYTFTLVAKQGLLTSRETVTVNVIADAITTTRLSGKVNSDKLTPLGGAVIDVGGVQTTTNADGSFLIELPTDTATTVKINGVIQQLSQLLGHQLYGGVNNQVGETIYIPTVDTSGSQTNGNIVTNTNLPQVTLLLPHSPTPPLPITLGSINSNLIPTDLFTTGTPKSLVAVTMTGTLTTPGKLTLGNDFTVDPGTMMDLWRIEPGTGIPTIVGVGKVSADGKSIDTLSGGVMGAGWYYYVPTPVAQQSPDDNAYNPISTLDIAPVTVPINSEANLFTGEVTEHYQLQGYQSLGVNQSLQLTYSSKRANPEQIVNFEYKAFQGSRNNGLFAQLILKTGDFRAATATRQWELAAAPTDIPVQAALKIDTSTLAAGIYTYDLVTGLNNPGDANAQSLNRTRGELIHANNVLTPFGVGWGLAGLQQVVINNQNSVSNESLLLIDGNGTEQKFTVINRQAGVTEYGTSFGDLSTFKRFQDGTLERRLIDGTVYKFYATGFLDTVTDRHGNKTTYTYDADNIILSIKDAANLTTTFIRNGNRIEGIKDPAGRITKLNYEDGNGNLTSIVDPDETKSKWIYDNSKHLMKKSIDKLNQVGTDEYDDFGRVTSAIRKDGSSVSFENSVFTSIPSSYILKTSTETGAVSTASTGLIPLKPGGSTPTIVSFDGNQNWTETKFNKFGQATDITDAIGTKKNIYNSRGSLIQTIEGQTQTKTSYNYNSKNQIVEIAYGDKLSNPDSPALYNYSDKTPAVANVNHIVYVNGSINTTDVSGATISTAYNYLVTSDKGGQIVTKHIDSEGKLSTNGDSFSLRNILGLNSTNKITVKKLLVGDFDGDNIKDIAVGYSREVFNDNLTNYLSPFTAFTGGVTTYSNSLTYTNDAGIVILKGDGVGQFTKLSNKIINPASNRNDIFQFEIADLVAADFNNDTKLDIVAANFINPGEANWTGAHNYQLYMLKNDGEGNLSSVSGNDRTNRELKPFKSVDYKGLLASVKQGNQNILVVASPNSDLNGSIVSTFSSDNDGKLIPINTYDISGIIQDLKTADLNNDGIKEIIINAGRLYTIDIVTNAVRTSDFTTQNTGFWSFIDVADVNGDLTQDIIVANDNSTLKVFLGNKFTKLYDTAPQIYQGTSSPRGLIVKDVNNDNLPDAIIGDAFAGFDIKLHVNNDPLVTSTSVVHQLFEYDPIFGQLTKSIDEEGRITTYELNSVGDITKITKSKSPTDTINITPDSVTTFTYIPGATSISKGLVDEVTDADGHVTKNSYDTYGRLTSVQQGFVGDLKLVSTLKYEDAPGYNSKAGNVTEKIDGNGKITKYAYQTDTNRIKTETYDASLGSNQKTNYEYDPKGQLISAINSDGYGQKFEDYDGLGRARTVNQLTATGEIVQRYEYYNNGEIKSLTNADNQKIEYFYDARNRVREIHNIDASTTKYQYDDLNNRTQVIDAAGYQTNYKYESTVNDSRTRLIQTSKQIKDADYLVTKYDYNKALQLTKVTDAKDKNTIYEYDGLGRQKQVTQQLDIALDGGATEIVNSTEYFDNGNIKSVTDGNHHKTSYTYDARNLKSTSTDELGNKTTYGYDGAGNLTSMSTANLNPTLHPGAASITYGYDALNRRTKVIDALNGETITTYDLSGNITKVEDANHHVTQYDYNPNFRTVTSKDALNNLTIATYDNLGRIQQVNQLGTLPTLNRITSYEYNLSTNTTIVTRPEGVVETTKRDSVGNATEVKTVVKGIIHSTKTEYDGLKHLTKITDAESNTQTFNYDNLGNLTLATKTDFITGAFHTTQIESNNLGWKTKTTNAEGQVFKNTYDAVGNIITQNENNLRSTRYTYDEINRQTVATTTYYDGTSINNQTEYDAVGNIILVKDAETNPTKYKYDALNRLTQITDAKNQITKIEYDAVGNKLAVIINPSGLPLRQTKYRYDELDRITDITDAEGIITHSEYNGFDDITSIIENFNGTNTRTTQFEYDKLGRKIKTTDAANHSTQTKYDEAGNITWVKDGNGNQTSYNYDKLNRRIETIDANNILTQYTEYDGFGNIKLIRDSGNSGGNITRYKYDLINRQTEQQDPHGKITTYHYDGLSRVAEIKDRKDRIRTFSYDINDNLRTESWGGTAQLIYTYDKVSNLKTSYDATSNTTNIYDYDEIYQVTDKTTGNTKFHYDYDVYGDLTKREDWVNNSQIATLDYTYNNNHQLTYLKQTGTGVVAQDIDLTYDRLSQLTQINRKSANDVGHLVTDYQYNAVGLLADINNYFNTPSTGISNYHYGYDAGNRLILTTGTDGNSAVDYGDDNQLRGIDNATRPDEAYNFNQLGIRDSWSTVAGDSRQLSNDGKYEYTYDEEGNLSRKKEISTGNLTNYTWDYRNRLTRVSSGSQTVEYGYDAEDKRVSKKINGVVTQKYVYDGADIALVVDAGGTLVERYLYGAGVDNVLSREKSGAVVWSLGDKQGSVVDLVDEHGVVLNHFVYDGFGSRTGTTGVDFRFGYTGRELDTETGLYYYRARYYDPSVGRFISEDPIGFSAGDTNLYRYVNNSPTNFTDPSGKIIPLLAWAGVAAVAGVVGAIGGAGFGFANGTLGSLAHDYDSGNLSLDSIGRAALHGFEGAADGAVFGFGLGVASTIPVVGNLAVGGFLAYGSITGAQRSAEAFQQGHNATGIFELTNAFLGAKFAGKHLGQGVADVQVAWINRGGKSHIGFTGADYIGDPDPGADLSYNKILASNDIGILSEQTSVPEGILARVKSHLFEKVHTIPVSDLTSPTGNKLATGRFEPSWATAEVWMAARRGFSKPSDSAAKAYFSRLIPHEYIESKLMEIGLPYRSTHPSTWIDGDPVPNADYFGAHDLSALMETSRSHFAHLNKLGLSSEGLIIPENLTTQHIDLIAENIIAQLEAKFPHRFVDSRYMGE